MGPSDGITSALSMKSAPQHARHGEWISVEGDALADDRRIGAEEALPDALAENGHGRFAGLVFFRQQQAAEQRLGAEHVQQAGLAAHAVDPLGLFAAGQRERCGSARWPSARRNGSRSGYRCTGRARANRGECRFRENAARWQPGGPGCG